MEHLSRSVVRAAEPAYLHCPQGWKFFLEICEIASGRWRGGVRIQAADAHLIVRVRSRDDRATAAGALQDAKDCAEANFRALERRRSREILVRDATALSCDERRKIGMLLMARLWWDQGLRPPHGRIQGIASASGAADAAAHDPIDRQSHGLREKSRALIDALRMPCGPEQAVALPDGRQGRNCRIGKKRGIDR